MVFVRVDDRLIHGQVVEGWLPSLNINEVVVVRENATEFMLKMMRMALPQKYDLKILTAAAAPAYVAQSDKNIFLIAPDMNEAYEVYKNGLRFKEMNVGGIHYKDGAGQLWTGFYLTEDDKDKIRKLAEAGVAIDTRSVPKDKNTDIKRYL
jgi:PTS system mannose-specific IIB component